MSRCNKLCAKNPPGISLIEAMLAVAVLLIGVLVAVNIFPAALKISKSAQQETIASNLAQAQIEEMFSRGYDNITTGEIEAKHRLAGDISNPFYYYQRRTSAVYVDGNLSDAAYDTGLKKITVIVYWITPSLGSEKNLPVVALISQR